jgi:hypothetical protein
MFLYLKTFLRQEGACPNTRIGLIGEAGLRDAMTSGKRWFH